MSRADGFVIPVAKNKVAAYRKLAAHAGKFCMPFPKGIQVKKGETVIFSWILYKSRAHRDRVNAKVMKDPRINCDPKAMPFDCARMLYGGFKTIVEK